MTQKLYRVRNVPVAKPMKVHDMKGREVDLTEERLRGIADRYDPNDPNKHEARVIIGHPAGDTTAPSHGYVEAARYENGYLKADYAGLSESAVKAIQRTGSHPRRSIEVINLGGDYLGDTAQLGATRPAMKGLPPIQPSQIEEMSEAECLAFAERQDDDPIGFLFSEAAETQPQEPTMADDTNIALAERATTAELKLAEETKAREDAELKLAEYRERETQTLATIKLTEATGEALKFAESAEIKPKLGAVAPTRLATAIAHASLNCPDIAYEGQTLKFGEFIEAMFNEMPNSGPVIGSKPLPAGSKPDGHQFAENDNSEDARMARIKAHAKEHDMSFAEASTAINGGFNA